MAGCLGPKVKKDGPSTHAENKTPVSAFLLRHNHLLGMLKEAKAETRPMPAQQTRLSLFSLEVVAGVVEALRAERATVRRRPSSPTRWPKTRGASSREILVPSVACWVDPGPARPWPFGIGKVAHSAGGAYTVWGRKAVRRFRVASHVATFTEAQVLLRSVSFCAHA